MEANGTRDSLSAHMHGHFLDALEQAGKVRSFIACYAARRKCMST